MFPHEYKRALKEMAKAAEAAEHPELSNEYRDDLIQEEALKTPREKVCLSKMSK